MKWKYVLAWFGMLFLAVTNGAIREFQRGNMVPGERRGELPIRHRRFRGSFV